MFGSSAAILFDDIAASASKGNNFFTNLFLLLSVSAACYCMGCGEQISELDEKSYQSSVSYIFLIIILYITCGGIGGLSVKILVDIYSVWNLLKPLSRIFRRAGPCSYCLEINM